MKPPVWRAVLALALVVPGGLLILAGLACVWAGLAPLMPWLSRLTAAQAPDPRKRPAHGEESMQTAPTVPGGEPHEPTGPQRCEPRPHEGGGPFLVVSREREC